MDKKKLAERFAYILGGALIGSATTFLVARRALARHYRDIADAEIASVKDSYDLLHKKGAYSDPKKAFEALKEMVGEIESYEDLVDEEGYFKYDEVEKDDNLEELMVVDPRPTLDDGRPDPEVVVHDIHDDRTDPPRYEGEGVPYVITVEEFMQDNEDFSKITVNYYEYDNTLSSEDDTISHNHESLLGPDFQNYIGWRSGGDHTVYVRNENMSSDYEILVSKGSYEEEVLGILPEEHPKKKMLEQRNNE